MSEQDSAVRAQRSTVQALRAALFSLADPAADDRLLERLAQEQKKLAELKNHVAANVGAAKVVAHTIVSPLLRPRLLGPETTELKVETKLHMQPLPTGIYHLLDPEKDPLFTVTVTNLAAESRRIRVTAYLEGLSAQAVRTLELKPKGEASFPLHPLLLPERARSVTEVQWATLHIVVDILGIPGQGGSDRPSCPVLCECHNTFPILCLARSSSFNSVRNPETGESVDLTRYYGAWVTPYAELVQERIRRAASLSPDKRLLGYQRNPESVLSQVKALYQSLKEAELTYVNSVIDYGFGPGQITQRTRLPREALLQKSANCIDGVVLMASMLEGASLNPAIVLVPGHAFLGWETWPGSGEFAYLETTMIGSAEFESACVSGSKQYQNFDTCYPDQIRRHSLSELRQQGIYPME